MYAELTVKFNFDEDETLDSVNEILENALPYMVDNIDISWKVDRY